MKVTARDIDHLSIATPDPEALAIKLQQIKETYADARISHIDGVSVDYDDWHFNVRPSNTEPLLRLNLESLVSTADMEAKRDEVLGLIRSESRARIGHGA